MKYKVALVITCTLALVVVTVAWAEYTGPNRKTTKKVHDPDKDKWTLIMNNPPGNCHSVCIIYHTCNEHPSVKRQEQVCCGVGTGWKADSSSCAMYFKTVTVNLPPATVSGSFSCGSPGDDSWCCGSPSLDLSANEPIEGEVITQIEGSPGVLCNPPDSSTISCSWTNGGEGSFDVNFWAISSYGDTSEQATETWRVDTIPPDVNLQKTGGTSGNSGWYLAGPVTLNVSGSDATSGLQSVELSIDGGGWAPSGQVTGDGIHSINIRARDGAGNIGSGTGTVRIDSSAPSISLSKTGTMGQNGWHVGKPVTVVASVSDPLSGVAQVEYKVNGGAWNGGTNVNLTGEGSQNVTFRALDVAGNTASGSTQLKIDTVNPSTHFTDPVDESEIWASGELTLSGTSTDSTSGISVAEISLNGGTDWEVLNLQGVSWSYIWDTESVPDGTYIVYARARDVAGNSGTTAQITVHVENIQPTPTSPAPNMVYKPTSTVSINPTTQASPTSVSMTEVEPVPTATNPLKVANVLGEPTSDSTGPVEQTPQTRTMSISLRIPWIWPALALIALMTAVGSSKLVDPRPRIIRQLREDLESIRESEFQSLNSRRRTE